MLVDKNTSPELHGYIHDSNLLRQYDLLRDCVRVAIETGQQHPTHGLLKDLNHTAVVNLTEHPGIYRPHDVVIQRSSHKPPPWAEVPGWANEFLQELRKRWDTHDPVWLAAYSLWRINWVHPFTEGNGRTARALCYFCFCVKFGMWLPGSEIIPQQIRNDREPYYKALALADRAYTEDKRLDLAEMQKYLEGLLKQQLSMV